MNNVAVETLVVGTAGAVAQDGTEYTPSISFDMSTGYACAYLESTGGSITVTQQCSHDDKTWLDPVDNTGAALGDVISAQGVTTGMYIQFDPVLAKYARFKVVEGNTGATTVTFKLLFQEVNS